MFTTIKKLFEPKPVEPVDVGRVDVTFAYETPDFRGKETLTFVGQWVDTKGVFGFATVDARHLASDFIRGTSPVQTKNGYIPRRYVYQVREDSAGGASVDGAELLLGALMNVVICSTDRRTIVEIDGRIHADSSRVLLFPVEHLEEAYHRMNAQVTIASLPTEDI